MACTLGILCKVQFLYCCAVEREGTKGHVSETENPDSSSSSFIIFLFLKKGRCILVCPKNPVAEDTLKVLILFPSSLPTYRGVQL